MVRSYLEWWTMTILELLLDINLD